MTQTESSSWRAIKNLKTTRHEMQRTTDKSRTQFIQLSSVWIAVAFITKCLSCLIVKCMLLTFIFNYFAPPVPERLCAMLPGLFFLCSWIFNLAFLLRVPGGYLCCTYIFHRNTHTSAPAGNLGRGWEEESWSTRKTLRERAESHDLFYTENMAANRELVLVRRCFYQ